jgi:hemerythrin
MISVDILWNDKMALGIEYIDQHHRTLIGLLLDAKRAMGPGGRDVDREAVRIVLSALSGYSKYHFLAEERLMLEIGFPGIDSQREAHALFGEKLKAIEDCYARDAHAAGQELIGFLTKWLVEHIIRDDAKIGRYMKSGKEGA